MEPRYIISVVPPKDVDAEPFDIPEWEYDFACYTAMCYRDRGWKAVIVDYGDEPVAWRMSGTGVNQICVTARNFDEAIMLARSVDARYSGGQRED